MTGREHGERLRVQPMPVKQARRFCAKVHRRLPKNAHGYWAVSCWRGVMLIGVAIVGAPARVWDDGTMLQVSRVACLPGDMSGSGHKGACSILYGACARAARAMGALNLVTYLHGDEAGTSLRGAGWILDPVWTSGGEHDRENRQRELAIDPNPKRRWWAAWSERAQDILKAEAISEAA